MHRSIEKVIQNTPDPSLVGLGELRWKFGLDYNLYEDDEDMLLANTAVAADVDPHKLNKFLPWKTWTEVRYGLIPRAIW